MCLWDMQFRQYVISQPRSIALTTSWARVLEPNKQRVGLLISPNPANISFWWPDELSGTTDQGILVPIAPEQPLRFTIFDDGDLPSRTWFAHTNVAGANVLIVEQFVPHWLSELMQSREFWKQDIWERLVKNVPQITR